MFPPLLLFPAVYLNKIKFKKFSHSDLAFQSCPWIVIVGVCECVPCNPLAHRPVCALSQGLRRP